MRSLLEVRLKCLLQTATPVAHRFRGLTQLCRQHIIDDDQGIITT